MGLEVGLRHDPQINAVTQVFAPLMAVPVAFCRRAPLAALLAFVALALLQAALGGQVVNSTASSVFIGVVLVFALTALRDGRPLLAGLAAAFFGVSLAGLLEGQGAAILLWVGVVAVGLPAVAGRGLRGRNLLNRHLAEQAAAIEAGRAERERAAVVAERTRIARELHDVVAHDVSVMLVQAQAARRVARAEPEQAREAIVAVEATGREALTELRRLLGVLRRGDEKLALAPQPSLTRAESLLARVRAAGLPVTLTVDGAPPAAVAPGVDATAYRVLQEALTNVLQHADAKRADVRIAYEPHAIELEVRDDGGGGTPGAGGHGLMGLRERVGLYGGELMAGTRPGGGFAVLARIPLEAAA